MCLSPHRQQLETAIGLKPTHTHTPTQIHPHIHIHTNTPKYHSHTHRDTYTHEQVLYTHTLQNTSFYTI